MKKIVIYLAVALLLFSAVILARNIIVKNLIISGIQAITGFRISLKDIELGLISPSVSIKNLQIFNPAGFSDKIMASIPELYVHYDPGAFLKGKVHLWGIRLRLAEFFIVQNENSQLNLNSLAVLLPKQDSKKKPPEVLIDVLDLKIGKIIYKADLLGRTLDREFRLDINEHLRNVTGLKVLVDLIISRALSNSGISNNLKSLNRISQAIVEEAQSKINEAQAQAKKAGQNLEDAAKGAVENTGQDLNAASKGENQ
jgi:hypothetical protein